MNWKIVELQIENIVPGILLLAETWKLANLEKGSLETGYSFIDGAVLVAAAYALGLISSLFSRGIVDYLSERGPRALIFSSFSHVKNLTRLANSIDEQQFKDDLTGEMKNKPRTERFLGTKRYAAVATWNAVYRWSLRMASTTSKKEEVDRRRSQGRLVRNLTIPLVLFGILISKNHNLEWYCQLIAAVLCFMAALAMYAYAEYFNFAEAFDISKHKSKLKGL